MARLLALLAATGAGCARAPEPAPPIPPALAPPAFDEAVDAALAGLAGRGLPALAAGEEADAAELLDLWLMGGAAGGRAARALEQEEPARLAARLLAVSENLTAAPELRRAAAAWLRARAPRAALPRLTLRLKYETDWSANVDLALALLRLGSGAGLEALAAILAEESREDQQTRAARAAAAAALRELPPRDGWQAGAAFAADWERLTEVRSAWDRERLLPGVSPPADEDLAAELWRTAALLRSQPLRPVDDARFVLARSPADDAFPVLLAAARDLDRYVRDHTLEVISWVGPPFGAWAARQGVPAIEQLAEGLGDPATRARVLEALGALGEPRAAAWILPWLHAAPEEATAAADALLRCADTGVLPALERVVGRTAEARFSLALLRRLLDAAAPEPVPEGLDVAEAARRRQWAAARAAGG